MNKVLAAALLAASPIAATAGELAHTYVEAGVSRFSEQRPAAFGPDVDYDGGYLKGAVALGPDFYAFGSVHKGSEGIGAFDLDRTESTLGIGYAHAIGSRAELLAEIGGERRSVNWGRFEGARASTGVRGALGERMEGWAKASYSDLDDGYSRFSAQAGALFRIDSTWGLTGEVEHRDEGERFSLGVRASF